MSLAHRRVVGYEALLRASTDTGQRLAPFEAFACAGNPSEIVLLDRICRAVHLKNFVHQQIDPDAYWLFLNVNPHVVVEGKRHGASFQKLLELNHFPAHRVVIEILEGGLHDEDRLNDAVNYYRDLGCLIAIDDFGAGHSNFDRIWRLRPDIVKFDRSLVVRAASDRNVRTVVLGMVLLVHEAGALVVMEGIENELEAMIAMDADADFAQGYYFARPQESIVTGNPPATMSNLFQQFERVAALDRANYRSEIAPYINGLGYSSVLLKEAASRSKSRRRAFCNCRAPRRCFVLDSHGHQIGENVNFAAFRGQAQPALYPGQRCEQRANWSRRRYFRRALAHPEKSPRHAVGRALGADGDPMRDGLDCYQDQRRTARAVRRSDVERQAQHQRAFDRHQSLKFQAIRRNDCSGGAASTRRAPSMPASAMPMLPAPAPISQIQWFAAYGTLSTLSASV